MKKNRSKDNAMSMWKNLVGCKERTRTIESKKKFVSEKTYEKKDLKKIQIKTEKLNIWRTKQK